MLSSRGIAVNMYIPFTMATVSPAGGKVGITVSGTYLTNGEVHVHAENEKERFQNTLRAMIAGKPAIANAALWNLPKNVYGSINLLERIDEGKSIFGPYHYRIVQFKRAHDLKEHYALQVSLLNHVLSDIQKYTCRYTRVELKTKTLQVDYLEHEERLVRELNYFRQIASGKVRPEAHKPPKAANSPWRVYANKVVAESKDLLMLPALSAEMRQCLRIYGMNTTDDVARFGLEKLRTILEEPFATDAYYNSVAYLHNKPVLKEKGHFPPPVKKHNLYFDFEATETFTKDNVSFVYLAVIYLSFAIFLFAAYEMNVAFISSFSSFNVSFDISGNKQDMFIIGIILAFFSGIMAGQMSANTMLSGLKHSIIMLIMTIITFVYLI